MRRKDTALIVLGLLFISVTCALPISLIKVAQAQTITLHLVMDSEDVDAHSEIANLIKTELAKIGIDLVIEFRDKATLASTVWGGDWDKPWAAEGDGWDMVWYEFPHPKLWALIVCGSIGGSFRNNTNYMYHVLSEHYDFDDIYYLSVGNYTSDPGVDALSSYPNVRMAINSWLNSKSGPYDTIFIYFSSHGGGYDVRENDIIYGRYDRVGDEGDEVRESTLGHDYTGDGDMDDWIGIDESMFVDDGLYWDDELFQDLRDLGGRYEKLIFVRQGCLEEDEGCYGGGLIDDISAPYRIIMTASNETSYSMGDVDDPGDPGYGYSEWSECFIDALHGERTHYDHGVIHESPPILVDADTNDDSYVSMLEAWEYAYENDPLVGGIWQGGEFLQETPWLDDNGNGEPTYVREKDVLDTTDGYFASNAYLKRDLGIHFYSWATPPNGGYNIMGWNNPAADEFLIGGMENTDPGVVKAYFDLWQLEWMHDPPAVIIYYPSPYQCARGIAFNLHHPVLSNRYVRQAIALAIPHARIFKDVLPSGGIVPPIPGRTPVLPWDYYQDVRLWNTKIEAYTYDIAKAQKYLDMYLYSLDYLTRPGNELPENYNKGPVGDANFDGKVNLDDLYYWYEEYDHAPSDDIDADFNNNNLVYLEDYDLWYANVGKEYPYYGAGGAESSSSPESPEEPPTIPTESEGPYVKVYVDQPLGYIPGQPPHRTVTVDIIIEVSNITDGSPEGIVGWGLYVQVDPNILNITRARAGPGYFLNNFSWAYDYAAPGLISFFNATEGYGDVAEQIAPTPTGGAGDPWSGWKLVTLQFLSKSKPKYSLIDLINVEYLTPDGKWHPVNEVIDGHYNPPPT